MIVDNLISLLLTWLLIGSAVWALGYPKDAYDEAVRSFVRRRGYLPPKRAMVMATIGLIVLWPKMARALWERGRV